jgi:hypothetical protein
MSSEPLSTAEELLQAVKQHGTRHDGQAMSDANRAQAAERVAAQADQDHVREAATFCEEVIGWLNEQWNAREFTAEQRIFSLALVTINMRQTFPPERGGKELFDRVSHEAWRYYEKASRGA